MWTKLRSIAWDGHAKIEGEAQTLLAKLEHIRWNMEQLLLGYAPLRPNEQESIREIVKEAEKTERPTDELMKIDELTKESCDKTEFPKTVEWLKAWEKFDEEKEILKANMSHVDICSCEELLIIDREAFRYDEDLTSILPQIHNEIVKIMENHNIQEV